VFACTADSCLALERSDFSSSWDSTALLLSFLFPFLLPTVRSIQCEASRVALRVTSFSFGVLMVMVLMCSF
jgi:hypothetical protein